MKNRIQSNQNKLVTKASMINLGIAIDNCLLFAAVPQMPGWEPERIAQGIRAKMVETNKRACIPNIRDVYEHVGKLQQEN